MGGWGFLLRLRNLWLARGVTVGLSKRLAWTGYTKEGRVIFLRPVPDQFPVSAVFGKWGPMWSKHMDKDGKWAPGQVNGKGQHKGVDFAVPIGTIVVAMAEGLVSMAGWENYNNHNQGFGQRVRQSIITPNGPQTLVYGHLSHIYIRPGDTIQKGDRVGLSGNTGHTSGPHLHVERVDSKGQYYALEFESHTPPTV